MRAFSTVFSPVTFKNMRCLSAQPEEPASLQKRLLLIEDDESVLDSLRMFLKADYEVHSASTVSAAVNLFKVLAPSLVILDLRLPDGDGLDVLRQIRCLDASAPVIILTGYASMQTVEESLRLGASDYLHKPFDGFALKSRVDQITRGGGHRKRAGQIAQATAMEEIADLERKARAAAMLLHDVAGPVTTALHAGHFLCEEISENPGKFGSDLQAASQMLHRAMCFVSALFEQSRSIEHLSRLEKTEFSVGTIVDFCVELERAKAAERKVSVVVKGQDPGAKICVNQFALIRTLSNFMRNAIEAVEPGAGRVVLSVETKSNEVEFVVEDNGPGIPPQVLERVFDAGFTTKSQGTGLGLYICKHLVESMNGKLTVRSEPGQGCRFSIRFMHSV